MSWRSVLCVGAVLGSVVGLAGCGAIKERQKRKRLDKSWEEREKEYALARAQREMYERYGEECAANEQSKCEALHAACMSSRDKKSACYRLAEVTVEVLSANPKTFDNPLQYNNFLCFERRAEDVCESLAMYSPPEPIELGVPDAPFDYGYYEDHCDEGADECYQSAMSRGKMLEGCTYGCGDGIKEANAMLARARSMYRDACNDKDANSCYKLGIWEGWDAKERARHPRRDRRTEPSELDKLDELGFYFVACDLGLYDACAHATYEILSYQRTLLVNSSHALRDELIDTSKRACSLAPKEEPEPCESHIFLMMREKPGIPEREALAEYAESIGASAAYDSLAYWEHPTWSERAGK